MAHTNIHDPLHVYSNQELPLTQLPVDNNIDTLHSLLLYACETWTITIDIQKKLQATEMRCFRKLLDIINRSMPDAGWVKVFGFEKFGV